MELIEELILRLNCPEPIGKVIDRSRDCCLVSDWLLASCKS